ncbi:MAG: OmpH family outer membrane protein [Nitrospira sp.]|nr:OmpH family outer membrane protein [Nitrospira sp.]
MKKAGIVATVALFMTGGWVLGSEAASSTKVGVMDTQMVMEKSKAGKAALDEVRNYSMTRQKIIEDDEQELRELQQILEDPNSKLSESAKQEKQELFQTKLAAYERRIQDFNREIQEKQRSMVEEYGKKIAEAAKAVAQKEGYTAILDKGNEAVFRIVLYHKPALDVTDLVIKEFDRQHATAK